MCYILYLCMSSIQTCVNIGKENCRIGEKEDFAKRVAMDLFRYVRSHASFILLMMIMIIYMQ